MELQHLKEENKGWFQVVSSEKIAGKMTYSITNKELIIIDHTEVDPTFKGQGIGKRLLQALVEYCRENNIKVIPLCPFAAASFQKDETIRDILK
jgi:predicted GNAT family acetyltransferase